MKNSECWVAIDEWADYKPPSYVATYENLITS